MAGRVDSDCLDVALHDQPRLGYVEPLAYERDVPPSVFTAPSSLRMESRSSAAWWGPIADGSPPVPPQTNGKAERFNLTLK